MHKVYLNTQQHNSKSLILPISTMFSYRIPIIQQIFPIQPNHCCRIKEQSLSNTNEWGFFFHFRVRVINSLPNSTVRCGFQLITPCQLMKFGSFQVLHIIVNHLFKRTEKQQVIFNNIYFYYKCIVIGQYNIIFPCNAKKQ